MDVQSTAKREVLVEEKKGLANTRNLILVGVMMAVGIVLRMFAGVIALGNMHPNFLIATYCLAIFIIKPNLKEAAAIGSRVSLQALATTRYCTDIPHRAPYSSLGQTNEC